MKTPDNTIKTAFFKPSIHQADPLKKKSVIKHTPADVYFTESHPVNKLIEKYWMY